MAETAAALNFTLPTAAFDQILPAIIEVLELAQEPDIVQNLQRKQALVQSVRAAIVHLRCCSLEGRTDKPVEGQTGQS